MSKAVLFLADGMADVPLDRLNGKTPLEFASTPSMDLIASRGASGTFLSLPDAFPTSSDVANMSVLGYKLADTYPGRGPIEAVSQDICLGNEDVAWRCNLVTVRDNILTDYSAGHIDNDISKEIFFDLQQEFGTDKITFHAGVSYRNLIVLHGSEFCDKVDYSKPDSSQGEDISQIALRVADSSEKAEYTTKFLIDIMDKVSSFLAVHPLNRARENPASHIWPWSPGYRPSFPSFSEKYGGKSGAVITAVDVISGIGKCASMDVIPVEGATGFIDTNYKGKSDAALKALEDHDFVYLHVEAIDECSHMGDLDLKLKAIEDFDSKIVTPVMTSLKGEDVTFAILPDHPVPIELRKHTRTPVPVSICGSHICADTIEFYSERLALSGSLGSMKEDQLMKLILDLN